MKNKNLFVMILMVFCIFDASLFAAAGDATTILKTTTSEQVDGEIGWLIIFIGLIMAAVTLAVTKNIFIPLVIFVSAIVVAMSPDLATGVQQQFS